MKMLKSFAKSRKFWIAIIGLVVAGVMYGQGQIGASELVDAILVLVGILTGTIALEDAALKRGLGGGERGADA